MLAWRLSNTLEVDFCVAALEEALSKGRPQIFNTDQGSQFTSEAFTSMLLAQGVQVSMPCLCPLRVKGNTPCGT